MASRMGARSVKDATRFTSTVPHATSKTATSSSTSPAANAASKAAPRVPGETPEQRVRRLRQAHLLAQQAQISRTDRVLDRSRRFLDAAHRFTIGGVILFTAVAGVVSVYSVWDMLQYNRARRAEWIEAQKRLEADELATARLAYLKGDATEDQILLVEEANREAEKRGEKLPSLLAPPEHRTHFEEHVAPALHVGNKASPVSAAASAPVTPQQQEQAAPAEKKGWFSFLSGSKKDDKASPVAQAWEQEKENQRRGGSLDRIGLEGQQAEPAKKSKGWWPW